MAMAAVVLICNVTAYRTAAAVCSADCTQLVLRDVPMESGPDMIATAGGRSIAVLDAAWHGREGQSLSSLTSRWGAALPQSTQTLSIHATSQIVFGKAPLCGGRGRHTPCRVRSVCATHRDTYIAVSSEACHTHVARELAVLCASGHWPGEGRMCGHPCITYVDPAACMATQVAQLAAKLAEARKIQQQISIDDEARCAAQLHEAVQGAVAHVSSEQAVHAWQARCRMHFGKGNKCSLIELAQMVASEARLQQQGQVSADLDRSIVAAFANPL